MITPALRRDLRVSASIKAHSASSKQGARTTPSHLFDLLVAPVDSIDPDVAERALIETPFLKRQTFAFLPPDQVIRTGMYLTVGEKDYPIVGLSEWPEEDGSGYVFYWLVLEDITKR